MLRWLVLPICYLIGSASPSYLVISRTRHLDLRHVGIGHFGTTGAIMAGGIWCGLVALAGDLGKGALAAWLALRAFGPGPAAMLGVVAVVLGHDFSVFYGFRGGKGFAAGGGALLLLAPQVLLLPSAYLLPAVLLALVILVAFRKEVPLVWQRAKNKAVRWHLSRAIGMAAICLVCFALLAWRLGLPVTAATVAAAGQWVTYGMLLLALLSYVCREWRLLASFGGAAALMYCLSAAVTLVSGHTLIDLLVPMSVVGWPGEALTAPAWEVVAVHHLLFGLALAVGGLLGRLHQAKEVKQASGAATSQ